MQLKILCECQNLNAAMKFFNLSILRNSFDFERFLAGRGKS